jgi:hypothetical protein
MDREEEIEREECRGVGGGRLSSQSVYKAVL